MTILTGAGKKFMEELPLGIHTFDEGTPDDVIKFALYGPNASLGPNNDAYTTDGEVVGGGYVAGGVTLTNGLRIVGRVGSSRADGVQFSDPYIQPVDDVNVAVAGVAVRGCMLYNASQANRNIFTMDFGSNFTPSVGVMIPWSLTNVITFGDTLIPLIGIN